MGQLDFNWFLAFGLVLLYNITEVNFDNAHLYYDMFRKQNRGSEGFSSYT